MLLPCGIIKAFDCFELQIYTCIRVLAPKLEIMSTMFQTSIHKACSSVWLKMESADV